MKRIAIIFAAVILMTVAAGCKYNPKAIIDFPQEPEYVGAYLQADDVHRIGHTLDTVASRTPVKWENASTGYQYSMMVFSGDAAMGTTTRKFSVLTIQPSGDAEVLNLVGTSSTKNEWRIVAEAPASSVGKAVRMDLSVTPSPEATHSSGTHFKGFMVDN